MTCTAIDLHAIARRTSEGVQAIHEDGGAVALLVVPTHEELEIAEQTLRCILGNRQPD